MDWEMDLSGEGEVTSLLFWLLPPWLCCTSCWLFKAAFPPPTPFASSAELKHQDQTFFLHLIPQLHQPQAPHLPRSHSDRTEHTMTSAGMTSAL